MIWRDVPRETESKRGKGKVEREKWETGTRRPKSGQEKKKVPRGTHEDNQSPKT